MGAPDCEVYLAYGIQLAGVHLGGRYSGGYSEAAPVVISMCASTSNGITIGQTAGNRMDPANFWRLGPRTSRTNDVLTDQWMTEIEHLDGYGGKAIAARTGSEFTVVWDPPSIPAAGRATTTFTIPYTALFSRPFRVAANVALQGLMPTAAISTINSSTDVTTVELALFNPTGAAIDLGSTTFTVSAMK